MTAPHAQCQPGTTELADLRRDVIELQEWKAAVLGKCKASDGFDAMEWGGDKEGWGFVHYFIGHLETRALHAETVLAEQDHSRSGVQTREDPSRDDLIESIRHAAGMISDFVEEYHDFDYEPHQVPAELEAIRRVQHHLEGSLITSSGETAALSLPEKAEGREDNAADAMIGQIEERFPNWKSYRDLVDCIDCTLHDLRSSSLSSAHSPSHEVTRVIGRNTKTLRDGDQVPGMPHAICHACGLGYRCEDPDCPNDKPNPMFGGGL
jgi:hypothetical protein